MNLSPNQILYYAWDISHKKSSGDANKYVGVLSEAKVDLNPHQIEAALFAFHSPVSKGAILADEVGLGKTIEAGIILSQSWAEHKRHILVIVPASLRNQWNLELLEKFYLPSMILEKSRYDATKAKTKNPFDNANNIIICSYQFFDKHKEEIKNVLWDLIVIDEAHKLRNVYKKNNILGNSVKDTLKPYKKVLLTATPLQNNLKELYGLVSIIDDHYFTTADIFSERYNGITTRDSARYGELRTRLTKIIHRTLRRQVKEFVKYTKRTSIVQKYQLSAEEQKLYDDFNKYLQRDSYGVPAKQKALLSLLLRKIIASSFYALGFTLSKVIKRLKSIERTGNDAVSLNEIFEDNEVDNDNDDDEIDEIEVTDTKPLISLETEIKELEDFQRRALDIKEETKARNLIKALSVGFKRMEELGANDKALIFTESRKTQDYIKEVLENNGFANQVVCFNGSNDGPQASAIYHEWCDKYRHTNRVSGNIIIDKKQSLVDYFHDTAKIMIATESGAEGINLQFCSMVVNYDMPWNPQRIEQRIGRCHRYGQKFDVVVINFVNESNEGEKRVYQLLDSKFNLFNGVFGSSDEILGAVESGVDIEKRLNSIFQKCRSKIEIENAFNELQKELDSTIKDRIDQSKKFLIENFDEEVADKLKIRQNNESSIINKYKRHFWNLLVSVLDGDISNIDSKNYSFDVRGMEKNGINSGRYEFARADNNNNGFILRASSVIGEYAISKGLNINVPDANIEFNLTDYPFKISILEEHKSQTGIGYAYKVSQENSLDADEKIFFCCIDDNQNELPEEFGEKLMELPISHYNTNSICEDYDTIITNIFNKRLQEYKKQTNQTTSVYVNDEIEKIEAWDDEQITPLENEIKEMERNSREMKRAIRKERNAQEKLQLMVQIKTVTKELQQKRTQYNKIIDEQELIIDKKATELKKLLENNTTSDLIYKFKWSIR
jgi:superfamily II DNA/RNA helicase